MSHGLWLWGGGCCTHPGMLPMPLLPRVTFISILYLFYIYFSLVSRFPSHLPASLHSLRVLRGLWSISHLPDLILPVPGEPGLPTNPHHSSELCPCPASVPCFHSGGDGAQGGGRQRLLEEADQQHPQNLHLHGGPGIVSTALSPGQEQPDPALQTLLALEKCPREPVPLPSGTGTWQGVPRVLLLLIPFLAHPSQRAPGTAPGAPCPPLQPLCPSESLAREGFCPPPAAARSGAGAGRGITITGCIFSSGTLTQLGNETKTRMLELYNPSPVLLTA